MVERLVFEDAERRIYESTTPGWPDQKGSSRTLRTEWQVDNETTRAEALRQRAHDALQSNRDFIASTPDATAVRNQVKKLSGQQNGIIRLLLNELDGTD